MLRFIRDRRGRLGDVGLALVVGSAGAIGTPEAAAVALLGALLALLAG